jgi:cytochrome b
MQLHLLSGYTMAAALLFRLVWGIIGSDTARFAHFVKNPITAVQHLMHLHRREPDTETGHNAAGGWMVLVMLGLLTIQVGTGLCSNDEISVEGPFARIVGPSNSDGLSHIHALNFRLIELVIVMHLMAILTYRVIKGHKLVRPMITGTKWLPETIAAPRLVGSSKAMVAFVVMAGVVASVVAWFGR